jgi:RNA polymerase sigma factor (sigma-70 family)
VSIADGENEKLVELVLAGNKDAYETIVQKYRDIVFAAVYSIVKNHHTAEDITQDTFFDGYLKINTLLDARKIGVWLIKIAKNKCYNYISRSDASKREAELGKYIPAEPHTVPENHFMDEYERYVVGRIIQKLPDTHRNTTVMFYFKKYSQKKIAEVLNIPEGTVKRRLYDAKAKLKREFELMAGDENYTPSADFEKNIIRSVNNISMVNIYKTKSGKMNEVKIWDIENGNHIGSFIEMTAPTESEIKDIARVTRTDIKVLESVLSGEEVKTGDKTHIVNFISDTEKLGVIIEYGDFMITTSQNEIAPDNILKQAIQSLYYIMNVEGYINVDCEDVRSVINIGGKYAHVGIGSGKGGDKGKVAAQTALSSPAIEKLLPTSKGFIISVTVSTAHGRLEDIDQAMSELQMKANSNAAIILGVMFDDSLEDEMKCTIIAMDSEEPVHEV